MRNLQVILECSSQTCYRKASLPFLVTTYTTLHADRDNFVLHHLTVL